MASKPVIVRLKSGEEYGVRTPGEAKRIYPDGKVIGYQSGEPYEEPKKSEPVKAKKEDTADA